MPDVGSQLMLLKGAECLLKLIVPCKTKIYSGWLPSLHSAPIWNKFVCKLSLGGLPHLQGEAVWTGLCGIWYVSGQQHGSHSLRWYFIIPCPVLQQLTPKCTNAHDTSFMCSSMLLCMAARNLLHAPEQWSLAWHEDLWFYDMSLWLVTGREIGVRDSYFPVTVTLVQSCSRNSSSSIRFSQKR